MRPAVKGKTAMLSLGTVVKNAGTKQTALSRALAHFRRGGEELWQLPNPRRNDCSDGSATFPATANFTNAGSMGAGAPNSILGVW